MIPEISVIIPTFNVSATIERTIFLIQQQTITNFEVIIIDDGSTDQTVELCNKAINNDLRFKVLTKKNGGPSSARNIGLSVARGEWITFCDADDEVLPTWLENFKSIINSNNQLILGIQGFLYVFQNGKPEEHRGFDFVMFPKDAVEILHKNKIVGYLWCKIFNRKIISVNSLKFNENLRFREDDDFVLRYLGFVNNVSSISTIGYKYYIPNFQNKYKSLISNYNTNKIIYISAKKLTGSYSKITIDTLKALFQSVYWNFKQKSPERYQNLIESCKLSGLSGFLPDVILLRIKLLFNYFK